MEKFPLYPLHPDYDPDQIAAKNREKRERIKNSYEEFKQRQEASATKELQSKILEEKKHIVEKKKANHQRLTFCDNLTGYAYMTKHEQGEFSIEHNAENDQFFRYNKRTDRFEMIYQHSETIVGILKLRTESDRVAPEAANSRMYNQALFALYDTTGNFYNFAELKRLEDVEDAATSTLRHTAIFEYGEESARKQVALPIDDIYVISQVAYPTCWQGDNS